MDVQSIINVGGAVILAGIGWFARQLWDATERLQRDLHALEVDLPKSYVHKNDLDKRMKHIEDMFQRIYDKLDGKVDK
jgi:aspartate aminotransferase-like enzyme